MTDPTTNSETLRRVRLSALERRLREEELTAGENSRQQAHIHELKQSFRRLIDPGIVRPNSRENTMMALKTLVALSDNLMREPNNPKYQRFKPTNEAIKRRLIDTKGALEYAVAMGFHLKVTDFQPTYVFNAERHSEDLRIGNEILHEAYEREVEKQERSQQSKLSEKELREMIRRNVQLNFQDDRRVKQLRDEQELHRLRDAAETGAVHSSIPEASAASYIPPGGSVLGGGVESTSGDILRERSTSEDIEDNY